jgi:syntaxin-binding protein 1
MAKLVCAEIDVITNRRSAEPRLEAVYLLMPTSQNVELVLSDYNPNPQPTNSKSSRKKEVAPPAQQEPPQYAGAHLHFIDGE